MSGACLLLAGVLGAGAIGASPQLEPVTASIVLARSAGAARPVAPTLAVGAVGRSVSACASAPASSPGSSVASAFASEPGASVGSAPGVGASTAGAGPVAGPRARVPSTLAAGAGPAAGVAAGPAPEELGARWGTEDREREYWRRVRLPIPEGLALEAGALTALDGGRLAVGTRHGEVLIVDGVDAAVPEPTYRVFASGLDEVLGLHPVEGGFLVTQSCELTRVTDSRGDGRADRFDAVSNLWGYRNYHEYAFSTPPDERGSVFVALGLSHSYRSEALFRGWVLEVTAEGETRPFASGLRSPGGIGFDEHGQLFYIESQGPWNSSCSLKAVTRDSFHGHPASRRWYEFAPELGDAPEEPVSGGRLADEAARIPELTPYAIVFPYVRMGRSIMGFAVDDTKGAFGPFAGQLFLADFSLSVILRATTEQVDGVWQGACYPFREGLSTGLLDLAFTEGGRLVTGGTNRGWPVRGTEPYALERLEWTGRTPFEVERITITPDGFRLAFTRPVDRERAAEPDRYRLGTFTHIYHGAYGGPEVDRTAPRVVEVEVDRDGLGVRLVLDALRPGHVHEFDLDLVAEDGEALLHRHAFYTVNAVPRR
jgi:hypothetical protein